jgi:nucleoside-diphosphate-sugar epimerase
VLRLSDIAPLDPARAGEEIVRADLADLAEVEAAMRGVDCVVHLGAIPGEDTWDKILPNNVVGTWNVFERRGDKVCVASSMRARITRSGFIGAPASSTRWSFRGRTASTG